MSNLSANPSSLQAQAVFRVDTFTVPAAHLAAFAERVRLIDQAVSEMPGCQQHLVLTQALADGSTRVISLVEWANAAVMADAKTTMQQRYAAEGFNPQAFLQALGVRAEFGVMHRH